MPRNWRFLPHDQSLVGRLCRDLNVSALTAQVLIARGYADCDTARGFLGPKLVDLYEPDLLPGVPEAADRVVSAIKAGRRITIYGDYDVDGVTSTAILYRCLKLAGATVDYYIPCRMEEGYGLNQDAIRQLHEEDPQRLVVSVDCGIASLAEAALARELGLELIVTDHHQMGGELPEAACLVHPRLPGTSYPFGELCGAGVAFKLAWAVCQRLGDGKKASPPMRDYLLEALGLAAIGTIADVVPLRCENRVLVRYGLESLAKRCPLGLRALMKIAKIETPQLAADDVGFGIGPRINAAGRLGQARLAVELLVTEDADRAMQLAEYLDRLNKDRRTVERRALKQARELVDGTPEWADAPALVLAHPEWHPGVVGIVASRVVEHFDKPAILIAVNHASRVGQGSCRSFGDFNLYEALAACSEHLTTFGGHAAAAGLKIDAEKIDAFREAFCGHVLSSHEFSDRDSELRIDAEVRLADVTHRAIRELDRLGPFGADNPKPLFAASEVQLAEPPRTMGEGGHHLQLRVTQHGATLRAIAFGRGEWAEQITAAGNAISIGFAPGINTFRGYENVELQLHDWRPARSP